MHTPDDGCHQFKFSQLLPLSFDVQSICWWCLLLAEKDLDVGSCGSLHVVPELPRNSQLPTTPSCKVNEGSVSRLELSDSIQSALSTFHVASLLDYDHLRGFQYLHSNSHVRNISFLMQNQRFEPSTFWACSWLITSHHLKSKHVTLHLVYNRPLLLVMHGFCSSVNIQFWQCSSIVVCPRSKQAL